MDLFELLLGGKRQRRTTSRDNADRRAGRRQGPYVNHDKLPRARNDNGRWRKKRSDAGKPRSS